MKPIATVINNNQPGWTNIIETEPNVTLDVGTTLYLADGSEEAEPSRENVYLANMAYLAYGQMTDYKNFRGDPMPDFDDLPEKIQAAWINAVAAVRRRIVKMGMTAEAK